MAFPLGSLMKNDQAIADIARTMKMYSMEGDQGSITDCVLRANRQGLDGQLIRFLTFHCSDETFAELVQAPGRKLKVVHYAKSIYCPRYFRAVPYPPTVEVIESLPPDPPTMQLAAGAAAGRVLYAFDKGMSRDEAAKEIFNTVLQFPTRGN